MPVARAPAAAARRPPAAATRLAAALLGLLLAACGGRAAQPPGGPAGPWWLTLRDGRLEEGPPPAAGSAPQPSSRRLAPWTVQTRVAEVRPWGDRLYLAVNGHGLARLEPAIGAAGGRPGAPRAEYFYDPLLFRYRTISHLLPQPDGLLLHLYFNATLNVVRAEDLKVRGISLLRFSPDERSWRSEPLPFQLQNPEWESVGLLPAGERRWLFEWKQAERSRTRFHYTAWDPLARSETAIERTAYLEAWRFAGPAGGSLPAALRALVEAARAATAATDPPPVLHLLLQEEGVAETRRYESRPATGGVDGETELLEVRVARVGGAYHALLPDGTLLSAQRAGARVRRERLPELPPGYRYGTFAVGGGWLAAAWEEQRFYEVGEAGIFVRDFAP